MEKDNEKRLGSGPRDAEEIKEHPFFQDVNWDKLLKREIRPPFVPQLKSPTDVDYFSTEFTNMNAEQEGRGSVTSVALSQWTGFSFIPPKDGS